MAGAGFAGRRPSFGGGSVSGCAATTTGIALVEVAGFCATNGWVIGVSARSIRNASVPP